jgi:hypothetical protein
MVSALWMKSEASLVSSLSIDVYVGIVLALYKLFPEVDFIKNNPAYEYMIALICIACTYACKFP